MLRPEVLGASFCIGMFATRLRGSMWAIIPKTALLASMLGVKIMLYSANEGPQHSIVASSSKTHHLIPLSVSTTFILNLPCVPLKYPACMTLFLPQCWVSTVLMRARSIALSRQAVKLPTFAGSLSLSHRTTFRCLNLPLCPTQISCMYDTDARPKARLPALSGMTTSVTCPVLLIRASGLLTRMAGSASHTGCLLPYPHQ